MAYNIAANQIHAKPVDSFFEGKALRMGARQDELRTELAEKQVANYDEDRAREISAEDRQKLKDMLTSGGITALQSGNIDAFNLLNEKFGLPPAAPKEFTALQSAFPVQPEDKVVSAGGAIVRNGKEVYKNEPQKKLPEYSKVEADGKVYMVNKSDPSDRIELGEIKSTTSWTTPQQGVNPETGEKEFFQTRTDGSGEIKWLAAKSPKSETEVRVERLEDMGLHSDRAFLLATGFEDLEILDSGFVRHLDKVSRKVTEIPVSALTEDMQPQPTPGHTLWDVAIHGTGLGSAALAATNVPLAWLGLSTADRTAQARQTLQTETQSLIRALVNNPKFPTSEVENIRKEVRLTPELFDDPVLMHNRMISINESLNRRAANFERSVANPNLPEDERGEFTVMANEIRMFLANLGVKKGLAPGARFSGLTEDGKEMYKMPDGSVQVWED